MARVKTPLRDGYLAGDRRVRRLICLLGCLVMVLACWNARSVLGFDFVAWDDDINIYLNPHLGPPGAKSLHWMFSDVDYMRRYVPLGWLAFSTVYEFSGLDPTGYHAAGLILHTVNSALVYFLLLALVRRFSRTGDDLWTVTCSFLGAILWALHPFRAETVGWSSGLLYAVAGCFALMSVLAFVKSRASTKSRHRWIWLVAASVLYTCSVVSYPMALGVAAVFLLMDIAEWRIRQAGQDEKLWYRDPKLRALVRENIAILAPAAAALAVTIAARFRPSTFWPRAPSWREFGFIERAHRAFDFWAYYLSKPLWPEDLSPAPSWLLDKHPLTSVACIGVVGGITLVVWRWRRRHFGPLLIWCAYLSILLPMAGLTEKDHYANDRYYYLVAVLVVFAVAMVLIRVPRNWRATALLAVAAVGAASAALQRRQLEIWKNTETLRTRIMRASHRIELSARNYYNWAMFEVAMGDAAKATSVLERAARDGALNEQAAELKSGLEANVRGDSGARRGNSVPALPLAHAQYAKAFALDGRTPEAGDHFRAALAIEPRFSEASFNWAVVLAQNGDAAGALHFYFQAVDKNAVGVIINTARAQLLSLIAEAFFAEGRSILACRAIELALAQAGGSTGDRGAMALRSQLDRYRAAPARARARDR